MQEDLLERCRLLLEHGPWLDRLAFSAGDLPASQSDVCPVIAESHCPGKSSLTARKGIQSLHSGMILGLC